MTRVFLRACAGTAFIAMAALPPGLATADDRETCAKASDDGAIAACTQAIASGRYRGTDAAGLYFNRGNAWNRKGDYDRAIADYTESIRFKPQDANAYNNRGFAWYRKGDYDRAIADYTEAIRIDPKYASPFINRGNAWRGKSDEDRAISDYTEAIRLDPKLATGYNNRGNAWRAKGDYDRALAEYAEAIRLNPNYASPYTNRGNTWRDKGDYDRAIADYTESIRLNPKEAMVYFSRGFANFYKGGFGDAAADFLRANDVTPDAYTMLWRFLARARMGQNGAIELSTTAAQLKTKDWPYPVIEFYLARRTVEEMYSAASKPKDQCEAAFYLGEWHLLRGNKTEAQNELQKAVNSCSKSLVEYGGAIAEIKRLNP